MPIQKTDRTTTWSVDANDDTWTLAEKATITVAGQDGISENGFAGSHIEVLGDIEISGDAAGVRLTGAKSSVLIGEHGRIDGKTAELGILAGMGDFSIVNRGVIDIGDTAIYAGMTGALANYGKITGGDNGVYLDGAGSEIRNFGSISSAGTGINAEAGGSRIENAKGAEISGNVHGITVDGAGTMEIVNKGIVRGIVDGINGGIGDLTITNFGKIFGGVSLGDGDDVIDSRKGVIKGAIEGGAGRDTFIISNSHTKIIEVDYENLVDEVRSTASYKLTANVEDLTLLGKADIDATGNEGDNTLKGNKGDNTLLGMAGKDFLTGGRGDDVMDGGTDADVFLFGRKDGSDVIRNFEDGSDRLYIDGVFSQETFDALDIRASKGDVVIDFGKGNEIRIENLDLANFTFDDIILLA